MKICIHAGHNPAGLPGSGAVGYLNESVENRKVCNLLYMKMENNPNIQVFDVTVNDGKNQQDVLNKLNSAVNRINPDLSISIHLNASTNQDASGVECYIYSRNSKAGLPAHTITSHIARGIDIPFRGVKINSDLSVLRSVSCPALLIECCFVTSHTDARQWSAEKCAEAIYQGLLETYEILKLGSGGTNSTTAENKKPVTIRHRMYIAIAEGTHDELLPIATELEKQGHKIMTERIE